jgi:hypothetical protein
MSQEITMARLNRDDYTNLPNKNFTANQPLPVLVQPHGSEPADLPVASTIQPVRADDCLVPRQIMDVGDLTDELQIPQRWYMAVVNMLAHQMAMELPAVDIWPHHIP